MEYSSKISNLAFKNILLFYAILIGVFDSSM